MWSNLSCGALPNCSISVMWSYWWLLFMTNLQCLVLLWFTLFWRKMNFVAIYALLCGAKINPQFLSVKEKWQISCMLFSSIVFCKYCWKFYFSLQIPMTCSAPCSRFTLLLVLCVQSTTLLCRYQWPTLQLHSNFIACSTLLFSPQLPKWLTAVLCSRGFTFSSGLLFPMTYFR